MELLRVRRARHALISRVRLSRDDEMVECLMPRGATGNTTAVNVWGPGGSVLQVAGGLSSQAVTFDLNQN